MLKLWGRDSSTNVQKVLWTLRELNLPYDREDAGGAFGKVNTPEYRTINPNGRIPTLIDGDLVMWESNACVRYLASIHGQGTLWPTDPKQRAIADMWMDWQQTTYLPAFLPAFAELVRVKAKDRSMALVKQHAEDTGHVLKILDRWLEGRSYIAADHLTMGDIPIAGQLWRYFTLEIIERPSLPNVERYYALMQENPNYRELIMVSYDILRVKED